jgi:ParB/RepB/Spo0J family partition protein
MRQEVGLHEAASLPLLTGDTREMAQQYGIKDIAVGRSDIYRLALDDIHVKEGWNCREAEDPENLEHIDTLARSIAEVGVKQPLTVYWEDGKAFISDGHSRYFGARHAQTVYGAEIKSVPVKTEDRYANEADRIFSQIVLNSGKPLTPFEQGKVFKRLLDLGWTEKEIATKAGRSQTWITDLLTLQAQPEAVKSLVRSGAVSATLATSVAKGSESDGETVEKLTSALETAKAAGKTRATAKHVNGPKRDVHAELREAFGKAKVKHGEGFVILTLQAADYASIKGLLKIEDTPAQMDLEELLAE